MNSLDIEVAVSRLYDPRRHWLVPNISWGMDLHECDLLVISKSGYATEVEIKVSKSDLARDAKKAHGHDQGVRIKALYFAIPEKLMVHTGLVPAHAGIIRCYEHSDRVWAEFFRPAATNSSARAWTDAELARLGRLAQMRIWTLKQSLQQQTANNRNLVAELRKLKSDPK